MKLIISLPCWYTLGGSSISTKFYSNPLSWCNINQHVSTFSICDQHLCYRFKRPPTSSTYMTTGQFPRHFLIWFLLYKLPFIVFFAKQNPTDPPGPNSNPTPFCVILALKHFFPSSSEKMNGFPLVDIHIVWLLWCVRNVY